MLECGHQFTHAVSWLVTEELHPNAPLTQSEMTAAAWADAKTADAELQALVRDFMKKLDSEDQGLLMQSQEAWSEYRNKFAQFESNAAKGGTLSPQLEGKAFATVTRTRTEELRRSILFTGWESNDEDVKR